MVDHIIGDINVVDAKGTNSWGKAMVERALSDSRRPDCIHLSNVKIGDREAWVILIGPSLLSSVVELNITQPGIACKKITIGFSLMRI